MRPVEMTGIVNRTTDFAQVRQNEEQKPVAEQYTFQAQFDKNVEKILKRLSRKMTLSGKMKNLMQKRKARINIMPASKRR